MERLKYKNPIESLAILIKNRNNLNVQSLHFNASFIDTFSSIFLKNFQRSNVHTFNKREKLMVTLQKHTYN